MVLKIASKFFKNIGNKLKYFLIYFLSQDPLEMTVSKIRGPNGFDNNPNQRTIAEESIETLF